MRDVIAQGSGVALLVLGAQGGIRLLADHANAGLLSWLPGGFTAQAVCYVIIAAIGMALASWGTQRSNRTTGDE